MTQPTRIRIGGLDAWDVPGQPGGPVVVLLHGFGADANDLLPLHRYMSMPAGTRWVVPDAPLSLGISPLFGGRAWFPIDQEAVQRAAATGSHRDLSGVTPPGLDDAREAVLRLVAELGTSPANVVLAGFSQGAMVATEVALTLPLNVAAMVLFSGTLLHEPIWRRNAQQRSGLRFFQSHGLYDPLLGVHMARRLNTVLNEAGVTGDLLEFPGHHEIPPNVLRGAMAFVNDVFANRPE